jgi:D-glycero-D-manno-heptose 1,7-bisphosphate phosphatase
MKKALFVDLDGTIRQSIANPSGFISHPFDQELIAGAKRAIDKYLSDGWVLFGVTNQAGVAAGHKSLKDCIVEQSRTIELAGLESVFFCPDFDGLQCYQVLNIERDCIALHDQDDRWIGQYRKPNAGMLLHAIDIYVPTEILFIGDREKEDKGAAMLANIPFKFASDWWIV